MACEIAGPEPSGHLKKIYRDPLTDMEDLTAKFHAAMATIDADMLHVQANIPQCAVAYQQMHGGHLQFLCSYSTLRVSASVYQCHH
jgi:hypothetical protein